MKTTPPFPQSTTRLGPTAICVAKDFKRIDDKSPVEEYDWERTVAEWNGTPVGFGIYTGAPWLATPNLYFVNWLTHPDYRRRGIGSAYWDFLQEKIFPNRTISSLRANARSDAPDGITFLEQRGFVSTIQYTKNGA